MATADRRKREARQRRTSILDAARKVFWQRGYDRATMPQIAEQAELAPGTLYLYFPSKDALYVELLAEGYELLRRRLQQQRSAASPRQAGARLIDAFFGFAREYPEYFDIIFFILRRDRSAVLELKVPPEQLERINALELACREAAGEVLQQVGGVRPEQRQRLLNAVWSMLAGVVFYFRNQDQLAEVAEAAKGLLLTAIFGPEQ